MRPLLEVNSRDIGPRLSKTHTLNTVVIDDNRTTSLPKLVLEINWCRTIKRNRINLPILSWRYWVSSIGRVPFADEVSGNSPHYINRAQLEQPLCPVTYTLCKVTSRFVWGTWDWYACRQNCARSSRDAIYNSYPLVGLHRQNENEI